MNLDDNFIKKGSSKLRPKYFVCFMLFHFSLLILKFRLLVIIFSFWSKDNNFCPFLFSDNLSTRRHRKMCGQRTDTSGTLHAPCSWLQDTSWINVCCILLARYNLNQSDVISFILRYSIIIFKMLLLTVSKIFRKFSNTSQEKTLSCKALFYFCHANKCMVSGLIVSKIKLLCRKTAFFVQ